MKAYERAHVHRAMPLLPVCVRLDGRAFHAWTKDLCRPYDETFQSIMNDTTAFLVEESNATIGYTQSDEITLIFNSQNPNSQIFFDGKIAKLTSVLASMCTAIFNDEARTYEDTKYRGLAFFDARVWQVPNQHEAISVLIWREADCRRNSITMAAQTYYSHKQLLNKSAKEQQEMLFKKGINWNDYPTRFKRGAYFARRPKMVEMTMSEWLGIPEEHRPPQGTLVKRTRVVELDLPPMRRITNSVDVVFNGKDPVYEHCDQHA